MMERAIERELLDDLPADDPRAIHARGDLRKVNAWMGHADVMAGILSDAFTHRPPESIVELGAGDGTFLLRLAQRLGHAWKPSRVVLVDQQRLIDERTIAAFDALGWNVRAMPADVFDWIESKGDSSDLILANLFLHHFVDADLRRLFARVAQRTGFFLACEPRRSPLALRATLLLWLIGCNDVTRHDARLSVQAGFSDSELSHLWPADPGWRLQERAAGWVSHCFTAGRAPDQTGLVSSIRQEGPPR
jgi:methyltransferase family protein